MKAGSDKIPYTATPSQLTFFSPGRGRLRFCLVALVTIFIAEALLMLVLALLPPLPSLVIALLDASLLVTVVFVIFWPQLKKEITFQNTRFSEAQETLRKSEERYRALVESSEDSIYLVNRRYCYTFINQKHLKRLGYKAGDFLGRPYSNFHSEEETRKFEAAVDEVFATGKSIQQEHQSVRDNRYFLRTLSPVRNDDGSISAVTVISKQITKQKEMEEELRKLSLTDALTGLYNRRGFLTLAAQQLKVANRLKRELVLISADLDDLKIINDTMGHQEGDKALANVAKILMETFRTSDIIARIGGDEFVALQMMNPDDPPSISTERLQQTLARFNTESQKPYTISISVGTVLYNPDQPKTLDELLTEADTKMYEQKRSKNSKT